jgi:hypothetical protein
MYRIFTFLREVKYYFFSSKKINIKKITSTKNLKYKKTNLDNFLINTIPLLINQYEDFERSSKFVFGKKLDKDIVFLNEDIFNSYKFNFKRFKPAYFNKADVKVPYEMARLQGLQIENYFNKETITYKDFTFPAIYWNSPMEVSIRLVNLIFHRVLLENNQNKVILFDNNKDKLENEIAKHFEFVLNNLENKGNVIGNHYLVELASLLLTISNFEIDLDATSFNEIVNEAINTLDTQFYEDGTNFEGSSHYAAFTTEIVILFKLAFEALDCKQKVMKRIDKILLNNKSLISSLLIDNELSQIGDNDSGRIFYLFHNEIQPLKLDWLILIVDSFFNVESDLYKNLFIKEIKNNNINLNQLIKIESSPIEIFHDTYEIYNFENFGVFIWRNDKEYFSIRCGPIGQNEIGGHAHHDQLSIEAYTNGKWIARDPGTGTYTDNIKIRNSFRSLAYHWGPNLEIKFPEESSFDCFRLTGTSSGKALAFNKLYFLGSAEFLNYKIYREIHIDDGIIRINDYCNEQIINPYLKWGSSTNGIKEKFSNGYKRLNL